MSFDAVPIEPTSPSTTRALAEPDYFQRPVFRRVTAALPVLTSTHTDVELPAIDLTASPRVDHASRTRTMEPASTAIVPDNSKLT